MGLNIIVANEQAQRQVWHSGHFWFAILDFWKSHFSCVFPLLWFQQRLLPPSGQAQKTETAKRNKAGNFHSPKKQKPYGKRLLRQI